MMPESNLDLKDKYFRKKMNGHFSDSLIEGISAYVIRGASDFISK
jgi:primosomal protein N' (replication factor Y)